MASIISNGVSGLHAAQNNLLTTSHNISNAGTPGFHRQHVVQSTNSAFHTSTGSLGSGVQTSTVQRVYSQFLQTQLLQIQTQSSQLDLEYTQIQQIDNMLADANSGLSPALQDFFSAVQDVATNPASVPSRQALINNAEATVARLQSLDERLLQISRGVNSEITQNIDDINVYARQVADLNDSILRVEGVTGQPPNDLLDQRDEITHRLSKLISADVVKQGDGAYNIFIGGGHALVVGANNTPLRGFVSPDNPEEIAVGFLNKHDQAIILSDKQLDGGALGGALAFRDGTLDKAKNTLGRIAIGLAQNFNDQHRLGQDLNGDLGKDFFQIPEPRIVADSDNNPASTVTAVISDVGALTTSDYRFDFDGANYSLTRLSDSVSVSTATPPSIGTPLAFDGVEITAATLNANEKFFIKPTIDGATNIKVLVQDTALIAAAAPIRTNAALTNTGNGTISAGSVNPSLPLDPNLQQPVTITFHTPADGQFDVTGVGTGLPAMNQVYTEGDDISFNGFTVQINGTPAAGDVFTIEPNSSGSADNRNALLLGALQTEKKLAGGTLTYQSAYGEIVSQVGNKTRELQITSAAQNNLLAQTERSIQSLSGVNLDEEAANLIRFQHAFQAASKVIEVSKTLFDSLLRI